MGGSSADGKDVIRIIKQQIIYRFGIPETITTDQGNMFVGDKILPFAQENGINLVQSSSYYAQANDQAEATNKILIGMIKKR